MNQNDLGLRIKQCRTMQKLTQEDLSEKIDVSSHYIYEIERGLKNMSLNTLVDLSTALDVSTDYLLFGTHTENSYTANVPLDNLALVIKDLSPQKRDSIADIISATLPHLK